MTNGRPRAELPKPIDIEQAFREALERLGPVKADCALIGGVALAIYGIERFTKDVDFATTVASSSAAQNAVADLDPLPLRIGGVSFLASSGVRVDLVDHRFKYRALYEEAVEVAKREGTIIESGEASAPVVPLVYLAAMKLIAGRPQDEADLRQLLKKTELDYRRARDLVERHAGDYAARALDRFARSAGRTDAPAEYDDEYGVPEP